MIKTRIIVSIITLIVLAAVSLALSFFRSLTFFSSFRIVFGSIYVLFLPGFVISYIFFPETKPFEENKKEDKERLSEGNHKAIDWIERIALSFALSIAIVPLVVFYLNLAGIKIALLNSFLTITGILAVSGMILYYKAKKQ